MAVGLPYGDCNCQRQYVPPQALVSVHKVQCLAPPRRQAFEMDYRPKQLAVVATGPSPPKHANMRTADLDPVDRDFLLFMPNPDPTTTLRAVFTFYSDVLTLTSEGDSVVTGETLQGLGTNVESLLQTFLGSIIRLAFPYAKSSTSTDPKINHTLSYPVADYPTDALYSTSSDQNTMADASRQTAIRASKVTLGSAKAVSQSGTPQLAQLGVESPQDRNTKLEKLTMTAPRRTRTRS